MVGTRNRLLAIGLRNKFGQGDAVEEEENSALEVLPEEICV
jgi:hypothetical protein